MLKLRFVALLIILLFSTAVLSQEDSDLTVHVVQSGDTLTKIAEAYGLTVNDIARANGIVNPSAIRVGQTLLIPLTPIEVFLPPEKHTIKPGDTLFSISQAYDVELQTLVEMNELANPDSIYIGQELIIRPETAAAPGTIVDETVESSAPTTTASHVIQAGETLFSIALRYEVTMDAIQEANGITDPSRILAGQELVIPGVTVDVPTTVLPEAMTSIAVTPLILTEGKTGRVRFTTRPASSVSVVFMERVLPVISQDNNTSHLVWLAIPLKTVANVYPMVINITEADGQQSTLTTNIQVLPGNYGSVNVNLPADKQELATQAVEDNEYDLLKRTSTPFTETSYFNGPMSLPAAAPMNAPFGPLRSYNGVSFGSYHNGADFAGAPGSSVLAAAGGKVVLADTLNIRGISVMIDHGWGIYTVYSHLSSRSVNIGDTVTAGQLLGAVGSTGRATGAHLHWEVWVNGVPVDPLQWVYQPFP